MAKKKEVIDEETSRKMVRVDIDSFNNQFYSDFDTQYFIQKSVYLVSLLSKPELMKKNLSEGVSYDRLKIKIDGKDYDELFGKTLVNNLKTDVALTYYHAIETLFRLIFGHTVAKDCPWIEISVQNDFAKFKKNVNEFKNKKYFKNHTEGLSYVFFGTTKKIPKIEEEVWQKNIEKLDEFLQHCASDLLESFVYNNYKHGFTVFASTIGFSLGDLIKAEKDDALVFLTHEKDKERKGYRRLYKNHLFSRWQNKFALIYTITYLIENIINVGGWKYAGKEYRVRTFENLDLVKLLKNKDDNPFQPTVLKMGSFSFKPTENKKK